jgi:hypothetical protein
MAAFNTDVLVGTSLSLLYSVPVETPAKKAIVNIALVNSNTSTEQLVSLYAIPNGQSTTATNLLYLQAGVPLKTFGMTGANAEVTGRTFVGGYSLMGISTATGTSVHCSGELVINIGA